MLNNCKTILKSLLLLCFPLILSVPAYALDSDLQYWFETENEEEFVQVGRTEIDYNGQIPDYLLNIYDFTPQTVYTSENGTNIVTPTAPLENYNSHAPYNAPVDAFAKSPTTLINGTTQNGYENINIGNNTTNKLPDNSYNDYNTNYNPYPLTYIEEVRNDDGSIGVLRIPEIDLKVTVYDGDTYAAMKKGVGHISSTSVWSGNIGLVGHNRGTNNYFGKLKNLSIGDKITYKTNIGTKTYYVTYVGKINETDWSQLQYTSNNRITLITCVENSSTQRLCVQAEER